MNKDTKPIKIKATVMWACLKRPSEMSGDYQVDLTNLSPAAVEALNEIGIEARQNPKYPEKGFFITTKSKYPIKALDTDGDEILDNVGNGSKATAIIGAYQWKYKNKSGVSPSLKKLVITDLVVYNPDDGSEVDDDEEAL